MNSIERQQAVRIIKDVAKQLCGVINCDKKVKEIANEFSKRIEIKNLVKQHAQFKEKVREIENKIKKGIGNLPLSFSEYCEEFRGEEYTLRCRIIEEINKKRDELILKVLSGENIDVKESVRQLKEMGS